MKRLFNLIVLVACISSSCFAQNADTIVNRIVLIGDAGALTNGQHAVAKPSKKMFPLMPGQPLFTWEIIFTR